MKEEEINERKEWNAGNDDNDNSDEIKELPYSGMMRVTRELGRLNDFISMLECIKLRLLDEVGWSTSTKDPLMPSQTKTNVMLNNVNTVLFSWHHC